MTRFHSPTRTAPDGLALPLDQNHPFFPGAPLPETGLEICAGFHEFFSFAMQNFSELLSGRAGARVSWSRMREIWAGEALVGWAGGRYSHDRYFGGNELDQDEALAAWAFLEKLPQLIVLLPDAVQHLLVVFATFLLDLLDALPLHHKVVAKPVVRANAAPAVLVQLEKRTRERASDHCQ